MQGAASIQGLPPLPPSEALAAHAAQRLADSARAAGRGDSELAAQAFEDLFAAQLVKEMRRCLPEGIFGRGPGAEVFEGWFDEHVGAALAQGPGLGLAEAVRASLLGESTPAEGGRR